MVITYAIGSFEPLSISSVGRRLCFRFKPLLRNIENTDAESVLLIVEASNIHPTTVPVTPPRLPINKYKINPVVRAVISTPAVASTTPGTSTGLISLYLVFKPPENRIAQSDSVPIIFAAWILLKSSSRSPSVPNNMPTAKNNKSTGTPSQFPALLTKILTKKSTEAISSRNSVSIINNYYRTGHIPSTMHPPLLFVSLTAKCRYYCPVYIQ